MYMISVIFGCSFLLTIPPSVGYEQNPLSLYYCYNLEGSSKRLSKCIAQVHIFLYSVSSLVFLLMMIRGFFFGRLQIRHGGNEWHLFSTLNLTWLLNHYKSVLSWYVTTLMILHHLWIDLVQLVEFHQVLKTFFSGYAWELEDQSKRTWRWVICINWITASSSR